MIIGAHAIVSSTDREADRAFLRDVAGFVAERTGKGVACGPVQAMGWGQLTQVPLPGGGKLGVYQPRHARPEPMPAR